jgi:hypothetical protein
MPAATTCATFRLPAPAMIGTLIKNENFAASSRLTPGRA